MRIGALSRATSVSARTLRHYEAQRLIVSRRGPNVMVKVASGEEGRLIGRQGRVIQAMRTLVRAVCEPEERLNVDLDAPKKER